MCDHNKYDIESTWVYLDDDGVEAPAAAESSVLMVATLNADETLELETGMAALVAADIAATAATAEQSEYEDADFESDEGSGRWVGDPTDADDWVLAEIVARRMDRALGTHTYLCKWKHFPENTWETRQTLEDEGHKAAVDAADAKHSDHLRRRTANATPPKGWRKSFQAVTLREDWDAALWYASVAAADLYPGTGGSSKDGRRQEREALSEAAGTSVGAAFVRRPMTKKMVKAAPRYVKDLFHQGKIPKKV